ncbi:C4-dicarboxylate TRAP transporter substrate-binding protein [Virgibacillus kimchii]
MRKYLILLKLLLVTLIFMVACGSTENSGAEKDVLVLKTSSQAPPSSPFSEGFDALLDEVEERSDGKIEFERYYSESLAKADNKLNALSTGVADVAVFVPTYSPGKTPLATISSNPAVWEDSWVGAKAINELYRNTPEMQEELEKENVKWIGQYALPSYYVISTTDVSSYDDLEGLRLIATGQMSILAEELGATSVGMPITDAYDAMQRGTIDGAIYGYTSSVTYGLEEAAESVWELPVGSTGGLIGMNMDSWNELPEDIQELFQEVASNTHPEAYHEIYQIEGDQEAIAQFESQNVKFNNASQEDIETLNKIAEEAVWETWIKEQEERGLPGREIMDSLIELVEKYSEENPYEQ